MCQVKASASREEQRFSPAIRLIKDRCGKQNIRILLRMVENRMTKLFEALQEPRGKFLEERGHWTWNEGYREWVQPAMGNCVHHEKFMILSKKSFNITRSSPLDGAFWPANLINVVKRH
jgi:hypothetical protein